MHIYSAISIISITHAIPSAHSTHHVLVTFNAMINYHDQKQFKGGFICGSTVLYVHNNENFMVTGKRKLRGQISTGNRKQEAE